MFNGYLAVLIEKPYQNLMACVHSMVMRIGVQAQAVSPVARNAVDTMPM